MRRVTNVLALLAFTLGTQHCAVMGLSGRDCGRPVQVAAAPVAPEHACCAAKRGATPATPAPAPAGDMSCCLQPAPLPVAAELVSPDLATAVPLATPAAALVVPDAPTRVAAPAPDVGSPPGAPTPEPCLGRAPPLA